MGVHQSILVKLNLNLRWNKFHNTLNRLDAMQNDWTGEANPGHVEPNACCGQEEYNDSEKCCISAGGSRKLGSYSKGECEEEENEKEDDNQQSLYTQDETPNYEEE